MGHNISNNMELMSLTLETHHFETSLSNTTLLVPENVLGTSVVTNTSHSEMSKSNYLAPENTLDMLVTLNVSHFEMSPPDCTLTVPGQSVNASHDGHYQTHCQRSTRPNTEPPVHVGVV